MIGVFFSDWLIFPYRGSSYDDELSGLTLLKGGDGQRLAIRTWRVAEERRGLVIFFHGNAEDIGHLDWIAEELMEHGWSVMAMDYRGYGLSEGRPTEKGCYADAEVVYAHALEQGFQPGEILFWGRSVGGGTAMELAVRKGADGVRGLVMESAFVTAFRAATTVPILPFDKFNNLSKLGLLELPLFVLHGSQDEVVATWHGERLHQAYRGRKQLRLVEGAGHNDLWAREMGGVLEEIGEFFEEPAP